MNRTQFERYRAAGYTRIPMHVEMLADLDNPLTAFLKVANQPFTFLFESVQGGEKWSRYSIVGLPSHHRISVRGKTVTEIQEGNVVQTLTVDDPLSWIDEYQAQFRLPHVAGLPPITGGLVGYFGYDTVRLIEPKLGENPHPDPLQHPDILLMVADRLLVLDNLSDHAQQSLGVIVRQLRAPFTPPTDNVHGRELEEADFVSQFGEQEYKAAVKKIKHHESLTVYVLLGFWRSSSGGSVT